MRVISQDGTIDIPYELSAVTIGHKVDLSKFNINIRSKLLDERPCIVATYSTETKAIKAMEMLREQYGKLEVMKVLASGTAEYMEKALATDEMIKHYNTYCDMNVFQFPQDDEIEV